MNPAQKIRQSRDAFHKWSDGRRDRLWDIIERLGKGEVSHKEAREALREEQKALIEAGKIVLGTEGQRERKRAQGK
jgi:hypothetical protein